MEHLFEVSKLIDAPVRADLGTLRAQRDSQRHQVAYGVHRNPSQH